MKKIINDPNEVVQDMIQGIVGAYPNDFKNIPGTTAITRKEIKTNKVGLVSGGGSGHEPAHAGYIGKGMLDAAVLGEVFTCPTPDQILEAIKEVDSGAGVLLIVKNYTGDILNFEMAGELAELEGIKVDTVVVDDDVAVEDSSFTIGRRGIAGTVFVHKVAGAKAEQGATLKEVKASAEKAIANVRSMGMSISSCTIPAVGKPSFVLTEDEMEIGMGIHGEPGIERKKMGTADEIAVELTDKILTDMELSENEEVAVIINGLGSTPEMELYILNKKVQDILAKNKIKVYKTFVGEYMTAIEMGGCSVTLLKLDEELKNLLDQPSEAPNFLVK